MSKLNATYGSRTVRFVPREYLISGIGGPMRVQGYVVEAGQIPAFAVRNAFGGWVSDEWQTGTSIVCAPAESRMHAVHLALDRLRLFGEPAYRKAVAKAKKRNGLINGAKP